MRSDEVLALELASLSALDTMALRRQWADLYRCEPAARISRDVLIRAIAWALQARAHGGLSKTAQRQLVRAADEQLATSAVSVSRAARHQAGTRLVREWQGKVHEVIMLDDGYLWAGKRYRSLSVIARAITGTRWSGPRFFGTDAARRKEGA